MRDRYSLVVGLIFAAVIVIAALNTIENKDEGTLGLDEVARHWPLPEFAVPNAAGSLEGDANVAQDDCESAQTPCPQSARRKPACRIRTPGAIRVCDFFNRPLVLSFWFSRGGKLRRTAGCGRPGLRALPWTGELPLARRARRPRHRSRPGRRHGWRMPVGYDRDGAVGSPLPGWRLSHLRLRLPRRHPAGRQHRRADGTPARNPYRRAAAGDPLAEGG